MKFSLSLARANITDKAREIRVGLSKTNSGRYNENYDFTTSHRTLRARTNKRGQVFLIGAVLFSIVLLSLIALNNSVVRASPNYNFDAVAKNVKNEMAKVVDYEINSDGLEMDNFIANTSTYLRRSYPQASFLFIYGNSTSTKLINFESPSGNSINVTDATFSFDTERKAEVIKTPATENFTVELNEVEYIARIYPSTQVYFAIEYLDENEAFVGFA